MAEDIEKAKEAALFKAQKYISNCLNTPDQLDKVEQIRRKVMRNKAAVDSRLKTAVQSQIDGIRSGLQELKNVQGDILKIKTLIGETSDIFKECEPLNDRLKKVEIAHEKHSRLAKTNVHLDLIFNVPDTIKTTEQLIKSGKLLEAHKNIMELESTRDDLLYEVFKTMQDQEIKEEITESPIYTYFSGVESLSDALCKQLLHIIQRTLSAAKNQPSELVTSLRIIEREDRSDQRCLEQQKKTNYIPPGRPKSWKNLCFATIRKSIDNRFDSNQIELNESVKNEDKLWLVRHLERMRILILEDLINVKHLVRKCFPPKYEIFREYIMMYHDTASRTLEDFALNQRRDRPNECVTLLNWVNEYDGPDLFRHEELKEFFDEYKDGMEPLLSSGVVNSLMETYVLTTKTNITNYLEKMCATESQDWYQEKLPDDDGDGSYQTSLPIILFQMLDQNLQVGAFIERDVKLKIVDICVTSLTMFIQTYRKAILEFKVKYYEDQSSVQCYEPYMVSTCNNCLLMASFAERMRNDLRDELGIETFGEERSTGFRVLIAGYHILSEDVADMLLESVARDLDNFFQELLTRKWLTSSSIVDTIIETIRDYNRDYLHLKAKSYIYIMKKAEEKIVIEYVRAILSRRITFRSAEERREAAGQILSEGEKIAELFVSLANLPKFEESVCFVLKGVAEVIRLMNSDIVSLEISGLATKYTAFRADHALALLAVRGDMGRTECLQLITDLKIRETDDLTDEKRQQTIFGRVVPAGSVLESLESRFKKT